MLSSPKSGADSSMIQTKGAGNRPRLYEPSPVDNIQHVRHARPRRQAASRGPVACCLNVMLSDCHVGLSAVHMSV